MSNLGSYQWLTTTAKRFGSPANMLAIFGLACFSAGFLFEKITDAISIRLIKASKKEYEDGQI